MAPRRIRLCSPLLRPIASRGHGLTNTNTRRCGISFHYGSHNERLPYVSTAHIRTIHHISSSGDWSKVLDTDRMRTQQQHHQHQPHRRFSSNLPTTNDTNPPSSTDVLVVGGGIAGICTAHYLLRQSSTVRVRLVDELPGGVARATSRINGGLMCPSLSSSWTNMPVFAGEDAIVRMAVRQLVGSSDEGGGGGGGASSLLKFDPNLVLDGRFWTFFLHWLRRKPHLGQQNEIISALMHHSMDCFNDVNDDIVQGLDYSRTAVGTRTHDGGLGEVDSSGDIGLFCTGLHDALMERHGPSRFVFDSGTSVNGFETSDGRIQSVNLTSHGKPRTYEADQYVIAAGNQSYNLCADLGVPCPIFPCKGYIVVFRSDVGISTNIELRNKAFVAPLGGKKYHLSGFAEFTSQYNTGMAMHIDEDRADALVQVAREIFSDMEVESVHVGYRPLSPDDTPLIGQTKYKNLFLNSGGGSKGWSQGPGSGQLLADIVLGNDAQIDADPYSPRRFELFS